MDEEKKVRNLKQIIFNPEIEIRSISNLVCSYESDMKDCQKCRGTGFIARAKGATITAIVCPNCLAACKRCFGICKKEDGEAGVRNCMTPPIKRVVGIINQAGLPARFYAANLKSFGNFTGNYTEAMRSIRGWLENLSTVKDPKGILLQGGVGVGKTFLLVALAKQLARHGREVFYVDFFQMILNIQTRFEQRDGGSSYITELINKDILVVDEMGKGRGSDFEMAVLDQIIEGRYNAGKIIIGATNYPLSETHRVTMGRPLDEQRQLVGKMKDIDTPLYERIGMRMFSRLVERSVLIEFDKKMKNMRDIGFADLSNVLTYSPEI